MSAPTPRRPKRLDIEELVRSVQGGLEEVLSRYCMRPSEAQEILTDTLLVLRVREHGLTNPRGWLLAAVEERCRRHVEEVDGTSEEQN